MTEQPSRPKRPIEKAFWVALFLPIGLILPILILGKTSSDLFGVLLVPLILALLVCPLYCGIRLALQWASDPVPRIFLSLALVTGLGFLYLAVTFAGCVTML